MNQNKKVLVTGASGFVGSRLIRELDSNERLVVTGTVRQKNNTVEPRHLVVGGVDKNTNWSDALGGKQVVVHTAARAHVMADTALDPLVEFRSVNVAGTLNLALQSADAGIKRFVFISSIKVNGEQTQLDTAFRLEDAPSPEDPYGVSKMEAEQGLRKIASETGMEVVIIRPPLVYGPGVKGNFESMTRLVKTGLPLPFGAIDNSRSLIGVDNLIDLIVTCIEHPRAGNRTFLASDGEDLSTTDLLQRVARAMGKPSRLISVPPSLLQLGATMLGKKALAQRLLGSLQVDNSATREILSWEPPFSVDEGLRRCFDSSQ